MAEPEGSIPEVDNAIDEMVGSKPKKKGKFEPSYRVVGESKIPVSKHHGPVWKGRRDAGRKALDWLVPAWNEAIRYYQHDQMGYRQEDAGNQSGNRRPAKQITDEWSETENVVFANTTTLLPGLYAQNPSVEITLNNPELVNIPAALERLAEALLNKKTPPGLNAKAKIRKCILLTLLTNCGWAEIGWTFKDQSNERVFEDLQRLAEELTKTKNTKRLLEIEGEIQAIEKHFDILRPEGPFLRHRSPFDIIVDPESEDRDAMDAKWIMSRDYLSTEYLNARFGKKNPDGTVSSVYKATHIISSGGNDTVDQEVEQFSLFSSENAAEQRKNFDTDEAYNSALRTCVWFVWDKTTKRVLLFADDNWAWPIWVWDDPLRLDRFFPFYRLAFHDDPTHPVALGEVTYYLDQQDAINDLNSERKRAMDWSRKNLFFDVNVIGKDEVEKILTGNGLQAYGLDIPDGKKASDSFGAILPPSANFTQLFDKEDLYKAIDRISSVRDVERGAQFKTNTTNKAIDEYTRSGQVRSDEKIDLIEDWMGDIIWGILQLCLQFMDQEAVTTLVGSEIGSQWQQMGPEDIAATFSMRVIGGSSKKPTSRAKKEEALQMGQVLGQFAGAVPMAVEVMLKVMEQAFDEIVIKEEDWQALRESITMQANKAGAGPGAAVPPGANGSSQMQPGQMSQIAAAAKEATAQGVPLDIALQGILSRTQ